MSASSNYFSILGADRSPPVESSADGDAEASSGSCVDSPPRRPTVRTIPGAPKKSSGFSKSWADYSDDEEPIPFSLESGGKGAEEDSDSSGHGKDSSESSSSGSAEQKARQRAFDFELGRLRQIKVIHTMKVFDKGSNSFVSSQKERVLRVVSQSHYEGLKLLIGRYRTHNNDSFVRSEQETKIKLANALMEVAYKNPKIPCSFVYPVVVIHLAGGRTIVRNQVRPGSSSYFEVVDKEFFPPESILEGKKNSSSAAAPELARSSSLLSSSGEKEGSM